MPWLERVPHRHLGVGFGQGAFGRDSVVVPAGLLGEFRCAARQSGKKRFDTLGVEAQARRQLPEERPEPGAEREDPGGIEVGERLLRIGQPVIVGDEFRTLHREGDLRRLGMPRGIRARLLQRVEGGVDFQGGESCCGIT